MALPSKCKKSVLSPEKKEKERKKQYKRMNVALHRSRSLCAWELKGKTIRELGVFFCFVDLKRKRAQREEDERSC